MGRSAGHRLGGKVVVLATLFVCLGVISAFAQQRVSLNDLVEELQKGSENVNEVTLVWWAPEDYWRVTLEGDPAIAKAQADEIVNFLSPYTIVFVVDGAMGKFGAVDYKTEADIRANLQIKDSQGNIYSPLSDDKIDANAKDFLLMMKPIFASMIGPMGQNMHAVVFPGMDAKGQRIAAPKKEGSFLVTLHGRDFKWKLPLGSLLPPKACPVDGEKVNGAWKFCPWHGVPLPELTQ